MMVRAIITETSKLSATGRSTTVVCMSIPTVDMDVFPRFRCALWILCIVSICGPASTRCSLCCQSFCCRQCSWLGCVWAVVPASFVSIIILQELILKTPRRHTYPHQHKQDICVVQLTIMLVFTSNVMLGSKRIYTKLIVEVPRANDFPEAIVYSLRHFGRWRHWL